MHLSELIQAVEQARNKFSNACTKLTTEQASFKPNPESWSIAEIAEHMVWAEQGGINCMWKAANGIRNKKPVWEGELIHEGLSIEKIIEQTWRPKENVPESAKPKWGGPLEFWISSLKGCHSLLKDLIAGLDGLNPEEVIYPHVISGPLNVIQRLEFLRFHLERHQKQIENMKAHPDFPKTK